MVNVTRKLSAFNVAFLSPGCLTVFTLLLFLVITLERNNFFSSVRAGSVDFVSQHDRLRELLVEIIR